MTFFVSAAEDGGEFVPYIGKVFEAGEYPDKSFAISVSELLESASSFEGVDLDLEHSEFRDLLGHRLGRLEKLWIDGRDAIGRLSVPGWLHQLAGGRLQTSLTFDRSKRVVGCALTLSPRIRDAEVYAAFSEFNPVGVGVCGGGGTRVGREANPSLRLFSPVGASGNEDVSQFNPVGVGDWGGGGTRVGPEANPSLRLFSPVGASGNEDALEFNPVGVGVCGGVGTRVGREANPSLRLFSPVGASGNEDDSEFNSVGVGVCGGGGTRVGPEANPSLRLFSPVGASGNDGPEARLPTGVHPHPTLSQGERGIGCGAPTGQEGSSASGACGYACRKPEGFAEPRARFWTGGDPHPTLSQGERGIGCGAPTGQEGSNLDSRKEIGGMGISLKERLKVLFRKAPQAVEEAGIDPLEIDAVEFAEPRGDCGARSRQEGGFIDTVCPHPTLSRGEREFGYDAPTDQEGSGGGIGAPSRGDPHPALSQGERDYGRELAEFKAANDRLIAGQLHTHAALFAEDLIQGARAVPAQRDQIIGLFKQAAIADGSGVVRFSDAGAIHEGANLRQLKDLFKNAQPHSLFNTEIPNADPNESATDRAVTDRLRSATALGQATIKKEAR